MNLPALAHTRVTAEPEFKAKDLSAELYYYLFSLLSIYLWCVCVCYMYMCEFACVLLCTHLEARRGPRVT